MLDNTNWTPFPDDNFLGIIDKEIINQYESAGISSAEYFVLNLDSEIEISIKLLLEIHRIAFEKLYDWAGKWRTIEVSVGQLIPPLPYLIPSKMYEFIDNLNYKISIVVELEDKVNCLAYAHYEFIKIHPFNNGNGRTGRILMNWVAMKFGYAPLDLYHRDGESRRTYIDAMKAMDNGDDSPLKELIMMEMFPF
jgi:cell filamentation protein